MCEQEAVTCLLLVVALLQTCHLSHTCAKPFRSHFDYCDVTYHVPPMDKSRSDENVLTCCMNQLELMQYNTALVVIGTC